MRETEIDRDAAFLFLCQPVGVNAGERANQQRFSMVDVAGGADGYSGKGLGSRIAAAHIAIWHAETELSSSHLNCGVLNTEIWTPTGWKSCGAAMREPK